MNTLVQLIAYCSVVVFATNSCGCYGLCLNSAAILQADMNPVAYIDNPRLGTALQMLQITDYIDSKLHEVKSA